jgi:outer membrane biosynthesis protein TonB
VLAIVVLNFDWSGRKDPAAPRPVAVEILPVSEISEVKAGTPDESEAAAAQAKSGPEEKKAGEKKAEGKPSTPDPEPADKPAAKPAKKQAALSPPPKPQKRRSTAPIPAKSYTQGQSSTEKTPPASHAKAKRGRPPVPPKRSEEVREAAAKQRRRRHDAPERERGNDRIARLLDAPAPETETRRASRFDPDRIAALLNRDPDAGDEPRQRRQRKPWRHPSSFEDQAAAMTPEPYGRPRYGQPAARDDRMSASEIDAFIAQVSRCWTPPVGGNGAENIVVRLHIELRENGRLARPPRVANSGPSPFFRPAADSAVRAVLQCEPYRLPPEKFSHWRDMVLNFDPRQMYGG